MNNSSPSPLSPPSPPSPETPAWQQPFALDASSKVEILLEGERPQPLLDEEQIEEFSVSSTNFTNPTAKLGLVAGGALVASLILWLILSGSFAPLKAEKQESPPKQADKKEESLKPTPDSEVGQLKSELALSKQEQQMAQLKNQENQKPNQPARQRPPVAPAAAKQPSPRPVRVAAPPPPRPAAPPSRSSSFRTPTRPAVTRPAPLPPPPPAARLAPGAIQVNPQEAWIAAAQLGSYGPGSTSSQISKVTSQQSVGGVPVAARQPTVSPPLANSALAQFPDELPVLEGGQGSGQRSRLPLGKSFRARLADSLAWDGTAEVRGVVELIDPITTRDGDELAPAGSLVAVRLANASGAGLARLEAQAIVILGSEEDMEIPLPANALLVRGREGKPLLAERLDRGGDSGGGLDWGGLLFDVARTGAEFGLGGGSGTNAYRDIYRFQRLESLYDRYFGQQQANPYSYRQPRQSTTAWLLPAGTEVELYVNQSFEFGSRNSEFGIRNSEINGFFED
jgi:hypothetical protein